MCPTTPPTAQHASPDTQPVPSKARSWFALMIASLFEIGFALSVNGAQAFTHLGWSISAVFFGFFTLFVLSIALRGIAVGIGYAVWAGIGAIGAAVLGPVFFDERLTLARALWLTVIIAGIVWLRLADEEPEES